MRILAVDPGEKNIGLAISDPSGTIANPLFVLKHISRAIDAAAIAEISKEQQAGAIIVGQALDIDGMPTPQGRRAARLAAAIRTQIDLPVELWDESFSTHAAQKAIKTLGAPRSKRGGHHDALAATYILQTYLDHISSDRD